MSDAMKSWLTLTYNGSKKSHKVTDLCESWTFTDNASASADTITLTLNDMKGTWRKSYFPKANDYMKVWLHTSNWAAGGKSKLYFGRFAIDNMTISGFPMRADVNGIALPSKSGFSVTQRNKTYKQTNLKQVLSDIAARAGLALSFHGSSPNIKEASQSGTTDMSFAFSLCDEYGFAMKLYNKKIVVYDQTAYEKKKSKYTIKLTQLGGEGAYQFTKNVHDTYNAVEVVSTDDGNKKVQYSFVVPGTTGKRKMSMSIDADSAGEAEKKGKAALRKAKREDCKVMLDVMGSAKYKAAECFKLDGFGKFDGKYFMDRVVHTKTGGAYRCSLEAHKVVTGF